MPRTEGIPGADGLPLWDTVEAIYFLIVGITAGIVIGFLFPSLWRAFRRRFRNTSKFSAANELSSGVISTQIVLSSENELCDDIDSGLNLEAQFVVARDLVQTGRSREAVAVYLNILGSEKVSKQATNRALFELSQAYVNLGLQGRAFDTAFELLNRKPTHPEVFEHLLRVVERMGRWERLDMLVRVWKGETSPRLRRKIAHTHCLQGESLLFRGQWDAAREVALKAVRWDLSSGRARILLWTATSHEAWGRCGEDSRMRWNALAADLEARIRIQTETDVSPAAGAEHLHALLCLLGQADGLAALTQVKGEVEAILGAGSSTTEPFLCELLLFASIAGAPGSGGALECIGLAKRLSPSFPNLETVLRETTTAVPFARGLGAHRCRDCQRLSAAFEWECPACGSPEALLPEARLFPPPSPANLSQENT